jgi:hypothetical protein
VDPNELDCDRALPCFNTTRQIGGCNIFAERPQAQRPRSTARRLHGGGKAEAESSRRDVRSGSLHRLV